MPHRARKEPLYRKVNTQTHRVHHGTGGNYRTERRVEASSDATRGSMHGKQKRGLDYTPLFKFLLSRVGAGWDSVYSEAVARLAHHVRWTWEMYDVSTADHYPDAHVVAGG